MSSLMDKISRLGNWLFPKNDPLPEKPEDSGGELDSPPPPIVEIETPSLSLLDNKPLVRIVEDIINLQEDIEKKRKKLPDDVQDFLDYINDKIDELLLHNELKPIENETSFNRLRHQSVPPRNVENGTRIIETVSCGFYLEQRVFKRAKVVVAQKEKDNG